VYVKIKKMHFTTRRFDRDDMFAAGPRVLLSVPSRSSRGHPVKALFRATKAFLLLLQFHLRSLLRLATLVAETARRAAPREAKSPVVGSVVVADALRGGEVEAPVLEQRMGGA
jgi:hypothetical protein